MGDSTAKKIHHLLSNGRCPVCNKQLTVAEPKRKIIKTLILIEYEDKSKHIKCPQCKSFIIV